VTWTIYRSVRFRPMRLLHRLQHTVPGTMVVLLLIAALTWFLFIYSPPTPPLLNNLSCTLVDGYHCAQDQGR